MRLTKILSLAVLPALLLAACAEPQQSGNTDTPGDTLNTLTDAEREAGWELLFDGQDLSAWKGFHSDEAPTSWVVEDGAISFRPDTTGATTGGDLVTVDEYADFELAFEWKISECGNSGLIYRADDAEGYEAPWETGPEFQILDNTCHPDAAAGTDRTAGANYDMNPPSQDVTHPAGEWNQARIVVDSSHVEHWLNGTKVVEYELWGDEWKENVANSKWTDYPDYGTPREGHIALQDHGNPVWFRNLKIRRL